MLRVDGEPQVDSLRMEAKYSFFADTKDEVTANMAGALGLLPDYAIAQSSTVLTAAGDFAFRKSDGTWSWLGD